MNTHSKYFTFVYYQICIDNLGIFSHTAENQRKMSGIHTLPLPLNHPNQTLTVMRLALTVIPPVPLCTEEEVQEGVVTNVL